MTVVAVMNAEGKIVLETMVPTAASRIRELIESLSGPLHVTLEEGPQAEWLHEVIRDLVKDYSERILPGTDFLASRDKDIDVYRTELRVTSRILRDLDDHAFRNIALAACRTWQ